jgi:hypothetical protein
MPTPRRPGAEQDAPAGGAHLSSDMRDFVTFSVSTSRSVDRRPYGSQPPPPPAPGTRGPGGYAHCSLGRTLRMWGGGDRAWPPTGPETSSEALSAQHTAAGDENRHTLGSWEGNAHGKGGKSAGRPGLGLKAARGGAVATLLPPSPNLPAELTVYFQDLLEGPTAPPTGPGGGEGGQERTQRGPQVSRGPGPRENADTGSPAQPQQGQAKKPETPRVEPKRPPPPPSPLQHTHRKLPSALLLAGLTSSANEEARPKWKSRPSGLTDAPSVHWNSPSRVRAPAAAAGGFFASLCCGRSLKGVLPRRCPVRSSHRKVVFCSWTCSVEFRMFARSCQKHAEPGDGDP